MVTEEGLRFLLVADVKDFERSMKDANTAAQQTAAGIVKAGTKIQGTGTYIDKMRANIKGLVDSMKTGEARFVSFGTQVDKTGKLINNFQAHSRSAGITLNGLTRIAQDAPFGFIAIQNNIAETVNQLGSLIKTTGGVIPAIKSLGQSLLGVSGIMIGINLAISGITLLVQEYGSLSAAIDAVLFPLTKQAQLQKEINDTIQSGKKDAQEELVRLETLYRAATNVNVPLKERNKIVDELQKRYPAYFGNLKNEVILAGKAAIQYENLRKSILAAATARAIEKKIEDKSGSKIDLVQKEVELNAKLAKGVDKVIELQNKLKALQEAGTKARVADDPQAFLASQINFGEQELTKLRGQIAANNQAIKEIDDANNALLDLKDKLVESGGAVVAGVGFTAKPEQIKNVRTLSDVMKELTNDLIGLDTAFISVGGNVQSLAIDKLHRLEKALRDVAEFGVKPGSEVFNFLDNQIKALQASLTKTPVNLKIPVTIEPVPVATKTAGDAFKTLVDSFDFKILTDFEKKFQDSFNGALRSGAASIASGIGTAIGEIAAGGKSLNAVFSGVIGVFGNFIKQLGESMIAAGTAAIAAKFLIKNPYTAVAAGIIAVAAGAAINASLNKAPSFATGGTVYGSQMIQAGDNTTQKEHILSDLQLNKIAQGAGIGGGGEIIAQTLLRGTDLVVLLKRATDQLGRING